MDLSVASELSNRLHSIFRFGRSVRVPTTERRLPILTAELMRRSKIESPYDAGRFTCTELVARPGSLFILGFFCFRPWHRLALLCALVCLHWIGGLHHFGTVWIFSNSAGPHLYKLVLCSQENRAIQTRSRAINQEARQPHTLLDNRLTSAPWMRRCKQILFELHVSFLMIANSMR